MLKHAIELENGHVMELALIMMKFVKTVINHPKSNVNMINGNVITNVSVNMSLAMVPASAYPVEIFMITNV